MLTAKDIMTTNVVTVTRDTDIVEAARLMLKHRFNGMPVVDEHGDLQGIITQSDLVTQQKRVNVPSIFTLLDGFIPLGSTAALEREIEKISATTVGQAMTDEPISVGSNVPVEVIASLMVDRKLHTLPVVDGGLLVGVIGKEDVLRVLVGEDK